MSSPGCRRKLFLPEAPKNFAKLRAFSETSKFFRSFFQNFFFAASGGRSRGDGSPARPGALPGGPGRPPPPFLPESDREVTSFFRTSKTFPRKIPDFNIILRKSPQNRPEKPGKSPARGRRREWKEGGPGGETGVAARSRPTQWTGTLPPGGNRGAAGKTTAETEEKKKGAVTKRGQKRGSARRMEFF